MNFPKGNLKRAVIVLIGLTLVAGSVSAFQYFSVSNTLSDEVDVVADNSREKLELSYVSGFELGGENKRFRVGDWEEFHIMVRNDSNSS
ncbi:hypothetical protein AKJ37_06435, partial [candidate division MSBL1 archaeon SCGC-AAA259I09]